MNTEDAAALSPSAPWYVQLVDEQRAAEGAIDLSRVDVDEIRARWSEVRDLDNPRDRAALDDVTALLALLAAR